MIRVAQNFFALARGGWPRVIGFAGTPSLLAVALLANLIALVPTAIRIPPRAHDGTDSVVSLSDS